MPLCLAVGNERAHSPPPPPPPPPLLITNEKTEMNDVLDLLMQNERPLCLLMEHEKPHVFSFQ